MYPIFRTFVLRPGLKGEAIMPEEYIKEIITLLEKCTDISTLDLIYQLLVKKCQNA